LAKKGTARNSVNARKPVVRENSHGNEIIPRAFDIPHEQQREAQDP
jgi:hypothetical protein